MVHSPPTGIPQHGDIVLGRANDGSSRYTLRHSGEAPQIVFATYEEAAEEADRFARVRHLDVWRTDDDCTFRRILEWRHESRDDYASAT